MARYIDADKFKSNIEKAMEKMHLIGGVKGVDVCAVIEALDMQPTADVVPKSEVESIITLNSQLEEKVFEERGKVERLHGILLQFTDIVHKWGTKNNIDTSEISLVPIMNEEADSIIQKANQDVAREIFEEIEKLILDNTYPDFDSKHKPVNVWRATTGYDAFYELKKKYTEGGT